MSGTGPGRFTDRPSEAEARLHVLDIEMADRRAARHVDYPRDLVATAVI